MRLTMEIPTKHLEELSPLCDGDFALAHLVLQDEHYAEFYASQSKKGRLVVLDNSMHELKNPLSVPEILSAAERIRPSFVVAPDKLGDPKFTYDQFQLMVSENRKHGFRLAVVLCGTNTAERSQFFMDTRQYADMLCLPFREPRLDWLSELLRAVPKHVAWPPFIHLLGVNELIEIPLINNLLDVAGWPRDRRSVDTAKPWKWALKGKRLSDLDSVRGAGMWDHTKELGVDAKSRAFYNIAYLRTFLG